MRFINKKFLKKLENKKINNNEKNPLFIHAPVISNSEKKEITSKYLKTIDEIILRLNLNQKLIISTVLSNDLYPPNIDVVKKNNYEYYNTIFSNIYKKIKR